MEADFRYFLNNYEHLCSRYRDKYVVIKDGKVLGAYDDRHEALDDTLPKEPIGTFIVQKCSEDSSEHITRVRRPVTVTG